MARTSAPLTPQIRDALLKLGSDIRDARRRRRLPMAIVAGRALITRVTLGKVERGNAGVSLGIYARVLDVLGLMDRLAKVADPVHDVVGRILETERLPQRVRISSRPLDDE